ncbi:MAG: hypothetical protein JW737_10195 [Acidobacteria bacterium]|nr:hypothetical protein [Acidobacteriota bacterium]
MDLTNQFELMIEDFRYIRHQIFQIGRPVSIAASIFSSEIASIHIFNGTLKGYTTQKIGLDLTEAVTINNIKVNQPKPNIAYITLTYENNLNHDKVLLDAPSLAAFNAFDKEIGLILNEIH